MKFEIAPKPHLYAGTLIESPEFPEARREALIAEHIALRQIFTDIENDSKAEIRNKKTLDLCAAAAALADIHNEDTVRAWGADAVLAGSCGVMMRAVQAMIEDQTVRFGDNSIYPRLLDAVRRVTPAELPDEPHFSPV